VRPPRIDVEWIALRAGIKPAIRRTADPAEADEMEARLRRRGAALLRSVGYAIGARPPIVVLYAARSMRDAEVLRDAEAPLLSGCWQPTELQVRCNLEVGRRLGYPRCCVEAFCDRVARGSGILAEGSPVRVVEAYVAARDAWVPRPHPWLNERWLDAHIRWITFEPCRYDCPLALRIAAATRHEVRKLDARTGELTDRFLAESAVIAPSGARAVVEIERSPTPVIARAFAHLDAQGRLLHPDDEALAGTLPGAPVGASGAVGGRWPYDPPPMLLDFGAFVPRTEATLSLS
jgi:hypothetical protein